MQVTHVSPEDEYPQHRVTRNHAKHYRLLGLLLLGIGLTVAGNYYLFSYTKEVPHAQQQTIVSPTILPTKAPSNEFAINSTTELRNWKTYVDQKENLAFSYPQDWVVTPLKTAMVRTAIRITPVSVTADSLTQSIMISIGDNYQNLSIEEYVAKNITTTPITYADISLNGVAGKRTSELPGEVDSDTVFVVHSKKIYQIRLIKSSGTPILTDDYTKFLKTVIIH